jgi:hypothetical protein
LVILNNRIPPTAESTFTAPANRLHRPVQELLIAAFYARDAQAPETHRGGDQPELLRQNFAVGEIPLAVDLPRFA